MTSAGDPLADLSTAVSNLDTELGKIWTHLETRAFMDTRGMPNLASESEGDDEEEERVTGEFKMSPAQLVSELEGFRLDEDAPPPDEVNGPIILRERIMLAMQAGEPWPEVPGYDTARARAAYAEFLRCTRALGGKVVFVALNTPMEEFVYAFHSAPGADVTPGDAVAVESKAHHVEPAVQRSVHLLLQTVTPGVAQGDQLILAPEARCSCSRVHSAGNLPVSSLVCIDPPAHGHLHL